MPQSAATKVYLNFSGGFVTEANPMVFPENTAKEIDNIDLKRQGQIQRRLGLEFETGAEYMGDTFTEEQISTYAITKHEWRSVNGTGNLNFLVVQIGGTLYFFDLGADSVSATPKGKIDFTSVRTSEDFYLYPVDATYGRGKLFVVGRRISPFYIEYDNEAGTFGGVKITVKIRDFEGIEEELDSPVVVGDEIIPDETPYQEVVDQDILDAIADIDLSQLYGPIGIPI